MPRWNDLETKGIAHVRSKLADLISCAPQYPEVVGDRKIIRFLRGHDYDLEKVCHLMAKFLNWRKTAHVDDIRRRIVEEEYDHPIKFPKGELILSLIPQLVMAPDAHDITGSPICVEQYNFSPSDVLSKISLADYIVFVTYSLEWKSMIIEQMSEERENEYLDSLDPEVRASIDSPDCKLPPYGYLAHTCVIRDLGAVGFEHLSSRGMEIIKAVINLASDNYPELMRKCYMINAPWIFDTAWYFVKGWLAARTVAKVSIMGSSYKSTIAKEIPMESLPKLLGGTYSGYDQYMSYPFNRQFLCPDYHSKSAPEEDSAVETIACEDSQPEKSGEVTPVDISVVVDNAASDYVLTVEKNVEETETAKNDESTTAPLTSDEGEANSNTGGAIPVDSDVIAERM